MSYLSKILDSVKEANAAANKERLFSPQIIQKTKAVRYPKGGQGEYAVITQTLQREDPLAVPPKEEINHYHIKLVKDFKTEFDAYVLGYPISKSLLQTIPWFQVGDTIEVVEESDYDSDTGNEISNTKKWRIIQTVIKVEELDAGVPYYSINWNQNETRAMAVFK